MPRANAIIDSFAAVIQSNSTIIDIGAGKGLLAQEMAQRFNARVTMVDVASYNQTQLPLTICDSRRLAFADSSFDYAILSFVLHHCQNPDTILREALRVANQVIVIENDVRGRLRSIVTRAIDSVPAIQYGTPLVARPTLGWVEAKVLSEYALEFGFFHNITVMLTIDGR